MMATAVASETEPGYYDILDYLTIARKRWLWVLLPVLLLSGAAAAWTLNQAPRYQAEAQVLLADTAAERTLDRSSQNTGFLSRELSNEISLAQSDEVEALVEAELGELPDVRISAASDADVLVFRAVSGEADEAALRANTWADQYIEVKRRQASAEIEIAITQLESRLETIRESRQTIRDPLVALSGRISRAATPEASQALQAQYNLLEDELQYELDLNTAEAEATLSQLSQLNLQSELSAVGEARFIQRAAPPSNTINAPLSRNLALGIILGLLAGFGLALLVDSRDTSIKSSSDIASVTDLPVLASIPRANKKQQETLPLAVYRDPEGHFAQGFHKVRSSIEFAGIDTDMKSILVTSPNAGEGKSTTSSNLALALATVGSRTVLVDVDFRRARLHKIFRIDQMPGLSDTVLNGTQMTSVSYGLGDPGLDNLLVVPTGTIPPSPAAFVGTAGFNKAVKWIRDNADIVVLDAPPLFAVSDAHTMARSVDAVVLAVMAGETTKSELVETISNLRQVGANLLGVVLTGVEAGDGYGRYYYYRNDEDDAAQPRHDDTDLWSRQASSNQIDLGGINGNGGNGNGNGASIQATPTGQTAFSRPVE